MRHSCGGIDKAVVITRKAAHESWSSIGADRASGRTQRGQLGAQLRAPPDRNGYSLYWDPSYPAWRLVSHHGELDPGGHCGSTDGKQQA
jgi:hypothetical protein